MLVRFLLLVAVLAVAHASPVLLKHWSSSAGGDKAQLLPSSAASSFRPAHTGSDSDAASPNHFTVSKKQKQKFEGIGGSFMRAGATVLNKMPSAVQEQILTDLFDPVDGAQFTVGKVPIACTDFGVPVWYTYAEESQSEDLPFFSIEKDLDEEQGFVPLVKRANAVAGKPVRLEATLDYLPRWMLNTTTPLPEPQVCSIYQLVNSYFLRHIKLSPVPTPTANFN